MRVISLITALPALVAAVSIPLKRAIPDSVTIRSVTYGGSGCPQGTLTATISADRTSLDIAQKPYTAKIGPYVDITENRKNCQINLDLLYPAGYSFSIVQTRFDGFIYLQDGVTGTIKTTFYFSGSTDTSSSTITLNGPFNGQYTTTDTCTAVVWSPCGGSEQLFNINHQARLTTTDKSKAGVIGTTDTNIDLVTKLFLNWRSC